MTPEHGVGEAAVLSRLVAAATPAKGGSDLLRRALAQGRPRTPIRVSGQYPSGEPRDYYLVPIETSAPSGAAQVIAFAELAADDGTLLSVFRPTAPFPYRPISEQDARSSAQGLLRPGERLGALQLTWHAEQTALPSSTVTPFFQAEIRDAAEHLAGYAGVALHDAGARARLLPDYRTDQQRTP
jgi:hypothetical protein